MEIEIIEKLARNKELKRMKRENKKAALQEITDNLWLTRHFRTKNHGNCTALYRFPNLSDRYLCDIRFSFCSPTDTFAKKHGRLEAFNNHTFTTYLPPCKPKCDRLTLQKQIDNMLLGFIRNIVNNAIITTKNRHEFEQYFGFPRWLLEFLVEYEWTQLSNEMFRHTFSLIYNSKI